MNRNVRIIQLMIIFIVISFLFTGCRDAQEVDDEVYALVLGVDKGVNNKVRITIQYPTYQSGGGEKEDKGGGAMSGGANQAPGSNIHTIEASTILEALDMYGMAISRRVSLTHTKMLVFSEEFARDGVGKYLGPMARYRETRRVMNVIVVKGKAQEFIQENKSNIGESLAKAMELMANQSENTSFFPRTPFQDFYKGMLSTYSQAYTSYAGINDFKQLTPEEQGKEAPLVTDTGFYPGELPRDGVAKREYAGTAVFDGEKMVGLLDSLETRYFLMVSGKFERGIVTIEDKKEPGSAVPLDMRLGRPPRIKGYFENGKPVIDIHLEVESDIGAIQSRIDYEKINLVENLNNQAKEHLEKHILQVIKKTQALNSDIFGFGHKIAGYFATLQEWEQYNWKKHYKEAEIKVDVSVNIRRTGLMIHSSPIRNSKGIEGIKEEGD